MQSNTEADAKSVATPFVDPLSAAAEAVPKKTWVNFDENSADQDAIDERIAAETVVEMENKAIATIEPSNSIQIANPTEVVKNIPDAGHGDSKLPVTTRISPSPNVPRATSPDRSNNNEMEHKPNVLQNVPLNYVHSTTDSNNQLNCSAALQTYSNGDVIVTLLPLNSSCVWITPATFKPELVPEELMSQCLSLTVEDYVGAMQILVNDLRFNLYITLYKRVLVIWIALGFVVLLSLLFSGVHGLALFGGGVLWLIINALGIFASMWIKIKLYHMLEKCMAHINSFFFKNNILVGVDDRGKLSCHKINLIFVYFDVSSCIKHLQEMIDSSKNGPDQGPSNSIINPTYFDINTEDIVITGTTPKNLSQKEKFAEKLLLRYSQRWVKDFVRRRIELNLPIHGDASVTPSVTVSPRHCSSSRCPCQFIEEHLKFKPLTQCSITELFI